MHGGYEFTEGRLMLLLNPGTGSGRAEAGLKLDLEVEAPLLWRLDLDLQQARHGNRRSSPAPHSSV